MNRFTKIRLAKCLSILAVIFFWIGLVLPASGWGSSSGLSLNIYRIDPDSEYFTYEEIGLIGVIKNEVDWSINTNRGMRELEMERFLIATDPFGVKHVAVQEGEAPEDMRPTPSWREYETVPADVLEPDFIRSVKITDLRTLFPTMLQIPGEWKVQAVVTISLFPYTVQTAEGVSGVLDERAENETITSNKLRFTIVPEYGARLRVRVEDLSKPDIQAQPQVPVRIYKVSESDIGEDGFASANAWKDLDPLVSAETDMGGWVTLPAGASCLPQPDSGDVYVAVAQYEGQYKEALFESDADGWTEKCSGRLEEYIFFNEKAPETQTFSVFGLNRVRLKNKVRIKSGDVGVQSTNASDVEVAFETGVWLADGTTIKADSVDIAQHASVWNVACNQLTGNGRVRGEVTTPLELPVWEGAQDFFPTSFSPGSDNINIGPHAKQTLNPGNYGDVTIGSHAILFLDPGESNPGIFQFNNLDLHSYTALICKGPAEIRIKEKLNARDTHATYIGPAARMRYRPEDVIIYVEGPGEAVSLGHASWVRANIFAQNGSLTTDSWCRLAGSFIAKEVTIGERTIVSYDGAFSEPVPGPAITLTASSRKWWARCYADLAWEGAGTAKVDIYRNGNLRRTTTNDGVYTDFLGWWVQGTFKYKVCDEGTDTCSNLATVEF